MAASLSARSAPRHVASRPRALRRCAASARAVAPAASAGDASAAPRRAMLLAGLAAVLAPPAARAAIVDDIGYEDRSRTRLPGECAFGDEGKACRMKALGDADALGYEAQQKVGTTAGGNRGIVSANGGGRSAGDRTYAAATAALVADVEALLAMDVYDPKRAAAVEKIKKEGNTWSGQYAPGGSSKRASGRAFYNAINQLQGHFAFNGLAPLPKSTRDKVDRNLEETALQLSQGR